jgi:hypothetical protein
MDHGPLSGIRRSSTPTQRRKEAAGIEQTIDKAMAEVAAAANARAAELTAAYNERTKAVPFTEDELKAARVIRTAYGWYRLVRVNAKTVTAKDGEWTARVLKNKILEVRL